MLTLFWHLEKTILLLLRSPLYIVYCIYIISELTRFKFANWECRLIILGKSKTETKVIIYSVDNFLNTEKWGESFVTVYSYQELHVLTKEITRNIIFNSSQWRVYSIWRKFNQIHIVKTGSIVRVSLNRTKVIFMPSILCLLVLGMPRMVLIPGRYS